MERLIYLDSFEELYNCSKYSASQWTNKFGKPNPWVGGIYLVSGFVYELLYIPLLSVMVQPKFFQRSCYKIMFYLGIVDFSCIFVNSIICGYWSIQGFVFCSSPVAIYVLGCFATGLWACACATCLLLAINRCLALVHPLLSRKVFGGERTWFWLILPTIYSFFFIIFTNPALFTSRHHAMFFNPYVDIPEFDDEEENKKRSHLPHTINNVSIIVLLSCSYLVLCVLLVVNSNNSRNTRINRLQQQTFIQASLICGFNATAAGIYVLMQFIKIPNALVLVGQIAWQASHGAVVFIYLLLNKSLRIAAFKLIRLEKIEDSKLTKKSKNTRQAVPESTRRFLSTEDNMERNGVPDSESKYTKINIINSKDSTTIV